MELTRLREQNLYWENVEKIRDDPHLEMLASFPIEIVHPIEENVDLSKDGIFIIRGPRQVGKTTFLKRTIRKLLKEEVNPISHLKKIFPQSGFWRNRGEVDFIGFSKARPELYLEVKYQAQITSNNKRGLKKTGGGIILSKELLLFDEENNILLLPLSYFLALLSSR